MHNFTHLLEIFVCLYIMLKSRKTKRGRIIRGRTNRMRQRGGFNLRDNVSVRGFVTGVNDDETVNVTFYDKSNSKTEVKNINESYLTFIRPGKEFRVRPVTDELVLYGVPNPALEAPVQGSRFSVKPLS
jgi:hypothetical protein